MEATPVHVRIKHAREYAGLTQATLAKLVGVKRSSANQWESPQLGKEPSTANLMKIAVITGVSFEWLATGRGEMVWQPETAGTGISEMASDYGRLSPLEKHLLKLFEGLSERRRKALLDFLAEER